MMFISTRNPMKIQEDKRWINQMEIKTSTLPRKSFISTTSFTSTTGTLGLDWHPFHLVQCPTVMSPSKWISFYIGKVCRLLVIVFFKCVVLAQEQKRVAVHCWFRCHSLSWKRHGQTRHPGLCCPSCLKKWITFVDTRKNLLGFQ